MLFLILHSMSLHHISRRVDVPPRPVFPLIVKPCSLQAFFKNENTLPTNPYTSIMSSNPVSFLPIYPITPFPLHFNPMFSDAASLLIIYYWLGTHRAK